MPDAEGADADPNAPDAEPGPDAASDDMMGPTIVPVVPTEGQIVSGEMTLIVTVTDPDGVDDVSATITGPGMVYSIDMQRVAVTNNWVGTFDTVTLAGMVSPTIVVRATDQPGNMSQLGFSVVLDNEGPLASLDPPRIREAEENDAGGIDCSESFDPVGDDAPSDGDRVLQLSELRARVFDLGNTGTTLSSVPIRRAGIASVEIYILDDTTKPLVVDNDGDFECDDINPKIVPALVPSAANEAAVIDLAPVPAGGSSFMPIDLGADAFTGSNGVCDVGDDADYPADLCVFASLTRVIQTPLFHTPEIYVVPVVDEFSCMGNAFDAAATNIADGWACVAVRAVDNLGNVRVSAPLRVCIDSNDDHAAPCDDDPPTTALPNCTGTYVASSDTVNNTACTPDEIPTSGNVGDYELLRRDL